MLWFLSAHIIFLSPRIDLPADSVPFMQPIVSLLPLLKPPRGSVTVARQRWLQLHANQSWRFNSMLILTWTSKQNRASLGKDLIRSVPIHDIKFDSFCLLSQSNVTTNYEEHNRPWLSDAGERILFDDKISCSELLTLLICLEVWNSSLAVIIFRG